MSPGMIVAVIGQALRKDHCIDYLRRMGTDSRSIILTSDAGAFKDHQLPESVSVRTIAGMSVGSSQLGQMIRRRIVGWMRGGSSVGVAAERLARRLTGTVRPPQEATRADHAVSGGRRKPNRALIDQLETINSEGRISLLVVFDVLDLPSVLRFADPLGIPAKVR